MVICEYLLLCGYVTLLQLSAELIDVKVLYSGKLKTWHFTLDRPSGLLYCQGKVMSI